MKNTPDRIRGIVPAHIAYWKNSNLQNYIGGPFADRSGGLISFEAPSFHAAQGLSPSAANTSKFFSQRRVYRGHNHAAQSPLRGGWVFSHRSAAA
jgi:hypothetical protein